MIEDDFDIQNIQGVNFGVALRGNGNRYFVPTDAPIKEALKEVLGATVAGFEQQDEIERSHELAAKFGWSTESGEGGYTLPPTL